MLLSFPEDQSYFGVHLTHTLVPHAGYELYAMISNIISCRKIHCSLINISLVVLLTTSSSIKKGFIRVLLLHVEKTYEVQVLFFIIELILKKETSQTVEERA